MIEVEVTLEYADGGRMEKTVESNVEAESRFDMTVDDWFEDRLLLRGERAFYGHVVGARAVLVHRPVGDERRGRREILYSRGVSSRREAVA